MDADEIVVELRRLRANHAQPPAGFADVVMAAIAERPRPVKRRDLFERLFTERSVTLRFRPASLALAAAGLAVLVFVVAGPEGRGPAARLVAPSTTAPAPVLVRFVLPDRGAHEVSIAGDFNGWRPESTPLVRGADGVWTVVVPLQPGSWSYSFVVDGRWVADPFADTWRPDGFGGRNAVVRVGDG